MSDEATMHFSPPRRLMLRISTTVFCAAATDRWLAFLWLRTTELPAEKSAAGNFCPKPVGTAAGG